MTLLVIQTSFLGDMVLTTPLLAHLATGHAVDVVATPAAAPLLANNPDVRHLFVYDKRGRDAGVGGFRRLARALAGRRYDAALLAQGSVRSAALAVAAGIRRRVGFDSSAGRWLYTTRVPYRDDHHHAERLFALGAAITGGVATREALRPRLHPGEAERGAVDDLLLRNRATSGDLPLVVLAPGSVWATKRWPYYPELARQLAPRARIVVVGSRDDAPLARAIATAVHEHADGPAAPPVVDATGALSLLASAELIGRAAVIVTNDSAPQHLASAMNTPTVALFGPTVPEFGFGPLAPRAAVLGHDGLACRPCDRHGPQRCPLAHWRCMRDILPERTADVVAGLLAPSLS